jgi:hypothetical protein
MAEVARYCGFCQQPILGRLTRCRAYCNDGCRGKARIARRALEPPPDSLDLFFRQQRFRIAGKLSAVDRRITEARTRHVATSWEGDGWELIARRGRG